MDNYLLTDEIVFQSKPDAVPYNYRISYKVAQLCIIIFKSSRSQAGCSLIKLHIISNALNKKEYMIDLLDYVNNRIDSIIVRFDPVVNRAIKYAIGDQLIFQLKNGTFKLTEKGKKLAEKVEKENVLVREIDSLNKLGTKLNNAKINQLMSLWRCKKC